MYHLLIWPNQNLSLVSNEVNDIGSSHTKEIVDQMFRVMYANNGVGLSAIQINVPLRIFVMDCKTPSNLEENIEPKPMVCINPVIEEFIGMPVAMQEGCLSFPNIWEQVQRYQELIFTCNDLNGDRKTIQVAGLEAQCVAHEMEHLDGITMATNWGRVKKDIVKRKIAKTLK
jgi:peptide deformylase